jgi:enoyl-CoA hydratase/carnithine racemase
MRHGFPAAICTPILSRLIGARLGLEFAMFGEPISADRLHSVGLINRLADDPDDRLESEFVGRLAALEPSAVKATRDLFRAAENMPLDNALDTGRQLNELIERTGGFARAGRKLQGS